MDRSVSVSREIGFAVTVLFPKRSAPFFSGSNICGAQQLVADVGAFIPIFALVSRQWLRTRFRILLRLSRCGRFRSRGFNCGRSRFSRRRSCCFSLRGRGGLRRRRDWPRFRLRRSAGLRCRGRGRVRSAALGGGLFTRAPTLFPLFRLVARVATLFQSLLKGLDDGLIGLSLSHARLCRF